jgi:hypothetical protein
MFLSLDDFLKHFPLMEISKADFAKQFKVMYATPQTLQQIFDREPTGRGKPIIKTLDDKRYVAREELIEYLYEIVIRNRHKYLTFFYQAYFEFKDPRKMNWKNIDLISSTKIDDYTVISLQKNDDSRHIVRNIFYLELLDLTKVTNTVKSRVSFWRSLENMYNKLELEDRFFAPSSIDLFLRAKGTKKEALSGQKEINYNNLFYLFQAYQPKASIFNPYSIKWIMDNVFPKYLSQSQSQSGYRIFTPVMSWASYLIGFMHSDKYQEYFGVDVMPSVCDKCEQLAFWYQQLEPKFNKKVTIRCQPSETLLDDKEFMAKQREYFDVTLICPPYFDMEIYHEGPQSTELYPNYDEWLQRYWKDTVRVIHNVTKPGGVLAVIANDYQTLDGESYPLTSDLNKITSQYFGLEEMFYLQNRTSPLRVNAKDRTERLFIYRRKN